MFNTKMCKNCFENYSGKPETCPHCGCQLHASKPEKQPNEAKQKVKRERKRRVSSKEIMESINFVDLLAKSNKDNTSVRKKKDKTPEFKVEKNGEYSINVKDVTYLPSTYTYSAKKARGEYDAPKIKWWEIYKWADLLLARRKIKKQVKKASYYRPSQFSKGKLIALCVFFGWMGGHNFYARNYRKGLFMLIAGALGAFVTLSPIPFFEYIRISIGGGLLFVVLFMWVMDLINLIFNTFSYRLSKWRFIDCLNTDSRATLGMKYIDKDEYKKPWYVRLFNSISKASKERKAKKQLQAEQELKQETTNANEDLVKQESVNSEAEVQEKQNNSVEIQKNKSNKPVAKQNKKAKIVIKKNKK